MKWLLWIPWTLTVASLALGSLLLVALASCVAVTVGIAIARALVALVAGR